VRTLRAFGLVLALTACAAPPPVVTDSGRPPPTLRFEPVGAPRAVVVALHGFNDRKAAFGAFGAHARAAGVAVVAFDQAGFGARASRGQWPGTERLVDDLHDAIRTARAEVPDRPVFVLGTSMGAAVAMVALARPDAPPVAGMILAAPAVWGGERLNAFLRAALWLTATVAPDFELSARGLDVQASDNVAMLQALARDPLYLPTATAANVQGLVRLMDEAVAAAHDVTLPRLVLVGDKDEIVPSAAFDALLGRLAGPACTVVRYPEGWHLLLRDHQRARVFADILAWLDGRSPPSGRAQACVEAAPA
jgi:alpha-beta hydrolase superfamily lysophospholipase